MGHPWLAKLSSKRAAAVHLSKGAAFRVLERLERSIDTRDRPKFPPVFIIGAPRSGTTLTMQHIVRNVRCGYFTNFSMRAFSHIRRPIPYTTSIIARYFSGPMSKGGGATNSYGHVAGAFEPTDGGPIWQYLFGQPFVPMAPGDLESEAQSRIRNLVAATESAFGAQFVNKMSVLSLRMRLLFEIFGPALFIWVRRPNIDVARSIYVARTTQPKYRKWIGARPAECLYDETLPVEEQVARQVHFIEQNIVKEREAIGPGHVHELWYHDLCANPKLEMDRVVRWLRRFGAPATVRDCSNPTLRASQGKKLDHDIHQHMVDTLADLQV